MIKIKGYECAIVGKTEKNGLDSKNEGPVQMSYGARVCL